MIRAVEPDFAGRLTSVSARKPLAYRVTEIQPGVVYERSGMKVTAFRHSQHFLTSLGCDRIVADAGFDVVRDAYAPNRRLDGSGRGIRA